MEGSDPNPLEPSPPRKRARTSDDSTGLVAGSSGGAHDNMLNGSEDARHSPTALSSLALRREAPYPVVNRDDYVRLIIQALGDLGFK